MSEFSGILTITPVRLRQSDVPSPGQVWNQAIQMFRMVDRVFMEADTGHNTRNGILSKDIKTGSTSIIFDLPLVAPTYYSKVSALRTKQLVITKQGNGYLSSKLIETYDAKGIVGKTYTHETGFIKLGDNELNTRATLYEGVSPTDGKSYFDVNGDMTKETPNNFSGSDLGEEHVRTMLSVYLTVLTDPLLTIYSRT